MNFTYSIGIFGSVSSGKSTLINSIFAKQLSQMNIRRTTMTPQVYIFDSESGNYEKDEQILTQNEEINRKFQQEIWDGKTINSFHSLYPKDFLPRNPNLKFQLYDLPGLNDQSTSHIYMSWAEENFHLFDCIILVIDINSGLNTSDEINICELIFKKMSEKKHVNLIVLANKCDEMDENFIICNEEKEDIYNQQIVPTLDRLKQKYEIDDSRCNIIKFCSKNAFIYRTIEHNTSTTVRNHLDKNHLHEMIQLEVLRSEWIRLSETDREERINSLIYRLRCDIENYEKNMMLSGFVKLRETLNEIVNNPIRVEPFYQKIISEQIERDDITKEECFENLVKVNSLILDNEFKSHLVQTIINFYVENYYNDYQFKSGRKNFNSDVIGWFDDLKILQTFEDYILSLSYVERQNISLKFFNKLTIVFLEIVKKFSSDILFIKIVDNYILDSFQRYEIVGKKYLDDLISGFIRSEYWNNRVFFDWAFTKGWKNKEGFIISYISENFSMISKENIFYLHKMVNQLRDKMEDVSIFCDMKKAELHHKMNFSCLTIEEINSFGKYEEKYGNFLKYLIEKN